MVPEARMSVTDPAEPGTSDPGSPAATAPTPATAPALLAADPTSPIDPSRPIRPADQPGRLAALDAAVRARTAIVPEIGIVLGPGLGALADDLDEPIAIPFADLPR